MKIGIITFHAAPNQGAALQAYALQTQLQKMGHESFFIDYRFATPIRHGFRRWLGRTLPSTLSKVNDQFRIKPFLRFHDKFLVVGQTEYLDHIQLKNNPPVADVYICGSDQIWNPNFINAEKDESTFWLNFGEDGIRRISYAASFGVDEISEHIRLRYADYARRFQFISVREKDAVELVKSLGRSDVVWVPDPTLLLNCSEYGSIEDSEEKIKDNYHFSYVLGHDNTNTALYVNRTISSIMKTRCYNAYNKSMLCNMIQNGYIGPGDWLSRLSQSNFVVTNSFHATIFSLLYHRPFIVILRAGQDAGANSRVASLLEVVGLPHRAIAGYDCGRIESLCREKVDWDQVDARLQQFREVGIQFLKEALS